MAKSAASLALRVPDGTHRMRVAIRGAVQGVGFRPFIHRLAARMGLGGCVNNSSQGVFIEVEGTDQQLDEFLVSIAMEKPRLAFIQSMESCILDPIGYSGFEIRESDFSGEKTALVLPDVAVCGDCLAEVFDPKNRRYQYPFTNCTNCGPRFSIIEALPYDRPNTTMKVFAMCDKCRAEYEDPLDRRFHAQPNACPACGPHLELWDAGSNCLSSNHEALLEAVTAIRLGRIVAVKGLGGFHLMADARNEESVALLRRRKHREEKPLALMLPDLESVRALCFVSKLEERLLSSPESPIVLLRRRADAGHLLARSIAPGHPDLGVMLPYTPLHHLLMNEVRFPLVATSGNRSDEPICMGEEDAAARLRDVADFFLVHNRRIVRHVDDSIARILMRREMIIRRARGYAPLPIHLNQSTAPVLAVGSHLKNAVAASVGPEVFVSQHIGDLETPEAFGAFERVISDFKQLYEFEPVRVACDAHPGYRSTQFARESGLEVLPVQHHYAHILSCMAENEVEPPALGVAWDGTGFGLDGTIWGGEFLRVTGDEPTRKCACEFVAPGGLFQRVAHFRTFRLPGGEKAVREPRRTAIGLLHEVFGERVFSMKYLQPLRDCTAEERKILRSMLARGINSPVTSSAGRLFDAIASIAGLRQRVGFEGQAAMMLEFAIANSNTSESYDFRIAEDQASHGESPIVLDWEPMLNDILADVRGAVPVSTISARFHNWLAQTILAVARRIGEERVVLSGGCFQNKFLTERVILGLRGEGFRPYWHQRVPPNDGGIALGQVVAAMASLGKD